MRVFALLVFGVAFLPSAHANYTAWSTYSGVAGSGGAQLGVTREPKASRAMNVGPKKTSNISVTYLGYNLAKQTVDWATQTIGANHNLRFQTGGSGYIDEVTGTSTCTTTTLTSISTPGFPGPCTITFSATDTGITGSSSAEYGYYTAGFGGSCTSEPSAIGASYTWTASGTASVMPGNNVLCLARRHKDSGGNSRIWSAGDVITTYNINCSMAGSTKSLVQNACS